MWINYPTGKNYAEVTIEDQWLVIKPETYKGEVSIKFDKNCIPQFIEILKELNDVSTRN
jgi:hypothetical protein